VGKVHGALELLKFVILPRYSQKYWLDLPHETISFFHNQPEQDKMNTFLVNLISKRAGNPDSILEIGAFTGERLRAILREFPGSRVQGIELNPAAVDLGNHYFSSNLGYVDIISQGDITQSNVFHGQQYKVVFSWAVLMYVHPIFIKRVLKNLLVVSTQCLILIEPSSKSFIKSLLPARNRSYLHNYSRIMQSLDINIRLEFEDVPADIWKPSTGKASVILISKID
jgi:hypothetical protein